MAVVGDEVQMEKCWTRHRILQPYVEGGHVRYRFTVIDGRIVCHFRCAHDPKRLWHYRRYLNEPTGLADTEYGALAVRACAALALPFGGVDLIRSPVGPLVLEVNHAAPAFDKDLPSLRPIVSLIRRSLSTRGGAA